MEAHHLIPPWYDGGVVGLSVRARVLLGPGCTPVAEVDRGPCQSGLPISGSQYEAGLAAART